MRVAPTVACAEPDVVLVASLNAGSKRVPDLLDLLITAPSGCLVFRASVRSGRVDRRLTEIGFRVPSCRLLAAISKL
jgi:hypothetical protein